MKKAANKNLGAGPAEGAMRRTARIVKYIRLLYVFMKVKLNKNMMYSFNFWMAFITDLSIFVLQVAMFSAIFLNVGTINGWNVYQMIVFIGTFTILDSLYMATYFFGVLSIPEKIRTGTLDQYILRPVGTLFYVSFENIDPGSLLLTVPGIMMVAYGVGMLGIRITLGAIAGYTFLLLAMYFLMYCLMIIIRSFAFRLVKVDSFLEIEGELVNFSFRVPGIVFRGVWKLIFYVFLPYGLMATIPVQFLTAALEGKYWLLVLGVCTVFGFLCVFLWRSGMKHYGSASS
ncbi:MAG TPA: ABC-2 family transporter protein [Clostridia bacterium]|nr:ABC-2 family transporter protein [Clostridia bacterium]